MPPSANNYARDRNVLVAFRVSICKNIYVLWLFIGTIERLKITKFERTNKKKNRRNRPSAAAIKKGCKGCGKKKCKKTVVQHHNNNNNNMRIRIYPASIRPPFLWW